MKIKVVYNDDIRRWRSSQENTSFEAIEAFVKQSWHNLPENYNFSYCDEEGDRITVSNDTDLQEAIQIARDDCRTSLKITVIDANDVPDFIVLGNRESSESDDDMYDAQKSLEEQTADLEAEPPMNQEPQPEDAPAMDEQPLAASMDGIHLDTALAVMSAGHSRGPSLAEPSAEMDEDDVKQQPTEEPEATEDQPAEEPADLKTLAQLFFSDEGILAQLPDMIDVLFDALRKNEGFQVALDLVFGTFPVVHEHEFVQRVMPFLPAFLPKLQSFTPFILLLGPDVVKQHATQLLGLVQNCMNSADGSEVDISPIMRQCCPNLIKLMEGGLPAKPNGVKCARSGCNFLRHTMQPHGFCCWRCKGSGAHGGRCEQATYNNHEQTVGVEQLLEHFGMAMPDLEGRATDEMNAEQEQNDGPVVHKGVTCDGCGVSPIVGARFKSAVIADYDLCAECEEKGVEGHPREYPMIKFGTTMQSLRNMREEDGVRFKGMGEFWWQSKKGHGRCGGRWGGHRRGRGRGGRRHGGRGRGGCPFKRWARPDWAADRMNQQDEEGQKATGGHHGHGGWSFGGHHGHGHHGMGWGGPYGHGHSHSQGNSDGHQGCPPWVAQKMAYLKKMSEEGGCPPWIAKKMAWLKSMAGQGNDASNQGPPAWARGNGQSQQKPKMKAAYVSDVNIPDRSEHAPDLTLIKTWKMRNTGKGTWEGCYLQFVKGDKSLIAGIEDTSLNGRFPVAKAAPSSIVEVSATIQTPKKNGRYCAYFRLHSVDGSRFGPQIWVDIKVSDGSDAEGEGDVDMSLRKCQHKRVQKTAKQMAKLDGKRRKLQKKLRKLEKREKSVRGRAEDSEAMGKPHKVAKFERKAASIKQKMEKVGSKLEDVTMERDERASVIEQLYAAPKPVEAESDNQAGIAVGMQTMSIDQDEDARERGCSFVDATAEAEQPTEQPTETPMVTFQYQKEFEQILDFGFEAEPNVVRYLLTEHKGNVGAVVNNLLAAS